MSTAPIGDLIDDCDARFESFDCLQGVTLLRSHGSRTLKFLSYKCVLFQLENSRVDICQGCVYETSKDRISEILVHVHNGLYEAQALCTLTLNTVIMILYRAWLIFVALFASADATHALLSGYTVRAHYQQPAFSEQRDHQRRRKVMAARWLGPLQPGADGGHVPELPGSVRHDARQRRRGRLVRLRGLLPSVTAGHVGAEQDECAAGAGQRGAERTL